MLREEFLESMAAERPDIDIAAFRAAMESAPSVSVKLNRRKATDIAEIGYGALAPVGWCESGYYLDRRPQFTLNPLLHAGVFYVQDASSMIYERRVAELLSDGLLPSAPMVLDLCAAPGGKTTSMINALPDGAMVVANEFVPQRASILRENLAKWGYPDIMVTNSATSRLAAVGEAFHLVAVDAPCSGEGMMRKDLQAVAQWSPRLVEQCAALQREILRDAVDLLLPGGILLYSTCTFNRHENEENVEWLIAELGMERTRFGDMAFMPHLTRGEGLFFATLRKPDDGTSSRADRKRTLDALRRKTKVILDGIVKSQPKGKLEIPASERVLATDYRRGEFPEADLDLDTALRYLRHEAITLPDDVPKGYVTVTYQGHPLGLVKNIGNRANNLYPSAWRIRMNTSQVDDSSADE